VTRVAVIGAGPGGEAAAKAAAARGAQVTLVEKSDLGGVCLNRGCIPSKILLEAGRLSGLARAAAGHVDGALTVRWDDLQKKKNAVVKNLRDSLAGHLKKLGVTVVKGEAKFKDAHTLLAGGQEVPFDHAVVAAGSEPFFPEPFPAFRDGILDSDRALALPRVPKSLLVVGGGAVGCEFACLFRELGAEVTLLEKTEGLLPGEDPAVVRVLAGAFEKRGIRILTGATVEMLSHHAASWSARLSTGEDVAVEEVLVCVGRRPAAGALNLEAAGVKLEKGRVPVDGQLRTNVPHIYAVGDVNGLSLLAHAASAQAETAVAAIFGEKRAYDNALVPRCLYTWPEVASVGEWAHSAQAKGLETKSRRFFFQGSPKALASNEGEGFIQVISSKGDDRLLGAQIAGPHATELIHIFSVALKTGLTVSALREVIFAHPTLSEGVREALNR
jgi:dihydrolipoamide dehydrogenase